MTRVLVIGLILGVATALSPRPVLFLLVGESVRSGLRGGLATLLGALAGDGLLAAGLLAVTLLLERSGELPQMAARLVAALGLFYLTYQLGVNLPRVGALAVEDVPSRVNLGTWPGLQGIRRGALACLGGSVGWAYWILVGTAIVVSLPDTALGWLIGAWFAAIALTHLIIWLASSLGILHLDTGILRALLLLGIAIFWLSGLSLLVAAARDLTRIWSAW